MTNSVSNRIKRGTPFYFYTFLMLMWSSRTSGYWDLYSATGIMTIVYLFVNYFFYQKYCQKSDHKQLYQFISLILIWYFISCIKYGTMLHLPYSIIYDGIIVFIAYQMMQERL